MKRCGRSTPRPRFFRFRGMWEPKRECWGSSTPPKKPLGRWRCSSTTPGAIWTAPFREMSQEQWDGVHQAVLKSVFLCSREYARRYTGDQGCILSMVSGTAFEGRKNGANYCSAKAGVVNLTKDMALELAPNIRVNAIGLGIINTREVMTRYRLTEEEPLGKMLESIPMNRLGTPEDVADCADFPRLSRKLHHRADHLCERGMVYALGGEVSRF